MVFLFLTYHTMGQFSKLTEGFDQTKNSWVACGYSLVVGERLWKALYVEDWPGPDLLVLSARGMHCRDFVSSKGCDEVAIMYA
jgi:hypothetical protein